MFSGLGFMTVRREVMIEVVVVAERETFGGLRSEDIVSRPEERLTEREMWYLGERNGIQKGRCGLQERGTLTER